MPDKNKKEHYRLLNHIVQASKKHLTAQILKTIIGSPLLFIMLSFIYPAVYLIEINSHIYTLDQIVVTLIFIFLVSLIATLIAGVSAHHFVTIILPVAKYFGLKENLSTVSSKLYRALLGSLGTLILLVLLHSANRELIPIIHNVLWALPYLMVSSAIGILTYRYQLRLFNFILSVLIVTNGAWGILHGFTGDSINLDTRVMEQNIVFKQKPNVYMVILESYASLDIRKQIYGINNESLTRELNRENYVTYKTYANYGKSLASVASVFMMRHHYYRPSRGIADGAYRDIIGGGNNNPVINIFLNNGYRVDYNKFDPYFYHPSSSVDTQQVQPLLQPIEVFTGLLKFSKKLLKYFSLPKEFFQSVVWLPEIILERPIKMVANATTKNKGKPVFSLLYDGATHSHNYFFQYPREIRSVPGARRMPLWKLNEINNYWITTYKNIIAQSDAALIELVRGIGEKDPDAVVILIGDHGPWLNRNRWMGEEKDLNKNMLGNGIQPAELTRDLFEVFMAIKWPKGTEKKHEYFSHVNLFRHIFADLTEDHTILKSQVANDSFISATKKPYLGKVGIYITVKDGRLLDRWVPFSVSVSQ